MEEHIIRDCIGWAVSRSCSRCGVGSTGFRDGRHHHRDVGVIAKEVRLLLIRPSVWRRSPRSCVFAAVRKLGSSECEAKPVERALEAEAAQWNHAEVYGGSVNSADTKRSNSVLFTSVLADPRKIFQADARNGRNHFLA